MRFYYYILACLIITHGCQIFAQSSSLAQEIISENIDVKDEEEFINRLKGFIAEANERTTVFASASPLHRCTSAWSKQQIQILYTLASSFIEVNQSKYPLSKDLVTTATTALEKLLDVCDIDRGLTYSAFVEDKVIQATREYDKIEELFNAIEQSGPPFTQTSAYLSIPALKNGVIRQFFDEKGSLARYLVKMGTQAKSHDISFGLVKQIVEQERAHPDHYVFYHGQQNMYVLFYDLIKELMSRIEKMEIPPDFEYLRAPPHYNFTQKLVDLLQKGFDSDLGVVQNILLSVNNSLFGSTYEIDSSSFSYFLHNRNITPFDLGGLLRKLPIPLGPSSIRELKSIYYDYFMRALKEGTLLQIFIDPQKVNDYVYLSHRFGVPLNSPLLPEEHQFRQTHKEQGFALREPLVKIIKDGKIEEYDLQTIDTKTFLEIYRNHPSALDFEDMDLIQARILLTDDFLLNPNSGVKIYRYTTMTPQNMQNYKARLHSVVDTIISDWAGSCQSPTFSTVLLSGLMFLLMRKACPLPT